MVIPSTRQPGMPRILPPLFAALVALAPAAATRADWTHYRGSEHDGTYPGAIRTNWSAQAPRPLWRRAIEPGLSSLTVAGGRVFTQVRRRVGAADREFTVALDAATGLELWSADLDVADYPNAGVGDDDGPRSTPVVAGDRVYVFTSYMRLYALEAATGQERWKRDFPAEFNSSVIAWQNAASPLVLGDLVLVNANTGPGRLTAVRAADGTTVWRRHDARMTQATPVTATVAGVPQVIFFTQPGLVSVRPETGDLLWQFAFPYSTSTAASPVVAGDIVYCSAAYTSGSGAVRIAASGTGATAAELWKKRNEQMNHWATPVAHDGHLYGVYGQSFLTLRCLEAATGNERWRVSNVGSGPVGYGSVLKAGGQLLILRESGELVLADPDPAAYRERERFRALTTGKCWNTPALSDGVLYARSTTEVAAYDLAPPAPDAPLRLDPALTVEPGRIRLTLRTTDGSPIPASRAASITLQAADDPAGTGEAWTTLPATPQAADGAVLLEDETTPSAPRRVYRALETP